MTKFEREWHNFWYEYIPSDDISYGSARKGRWEFRSQRLMIIIVITLFLIILL